MERYSVNPRRGGARRTVSIMLSLLLALATSATAQGGSGNASLSTAGPSLESTAVRLVEQGRIHLSGGIRCHVEEANGTSRDEFVDDDAAALLAVARYQEIFLFVHGFHPKTFGGRPSDAEVEETWKPHIELLRLSRRPFVACLFQFDTLQGFGDHQPQLGNFLFALRWLTDDPRLYSRDRRITLVGHSAGGNYVKHGFLLYQRHLVANSLSLVGRNRTPMRLVFLGTPHQGTNLTLLAGAGIALFDLFKEATQKPPRSYDDYEEKRWQERLSGEYKHMLASPGVEQLYIGNPELMRLNRQFVDALTENVKVFNLVGLADLIVPLESGRFGMGLVEWALEGVGHTDFLKPYSDKQLGVLLVDYYKVDHRGLYEALEKAQGGPLVRPARSIGPIDMNLQPKFAEAGVPAVDATLACERYARSRLINVQDANAKDIREMCVCAVRNFDRAPLPVEDKQSVFVEQPDGMHMLLWRITGIASGELSLPEVRAVADHLKAEINHCFVPTVVLYAPWSHMGRGVEQARKEYVPIPSRQTRAPYRGIGGLMDESVSTAHRTVYDIYATRGGRSRYEQSPAAYAGMSETIKDEKVLHCKYRANENATLVRYEYFWFRRTPAAFEQGVRDQLPKEHPLFFVGESREACPDRIPIR